MGGIFVGDNTDSAVKPKKIFVGMGLFSGCPIRTALDYFLIAFWYAMRTTLAACASARA